VITTNLPFKQWDTVFPTATSAVALIVRLTHHAEIVTIEEQSYRNRRRSRRTSASTSRRVDQVTGPGDPVIGPLTAAEFV
jgi:bifunctional ADP-heptose synthase (sugar kinase/adenylyltransferase)